MCRLDVTLAQSSSIAPDSSPRRVHLDAAVRGRLLRRAHLESLQHPASTRGKRFPSIGLGVDPRFLPLLVFLCPTFPSILPPREPEGSPGGGVGWTLAHVRLDHAYRTSRRRGLGKAREASRVKRGDVRRLATREGRVGVVVGRRGRRHDGERAEEENEEEEEEKEVVDDGGGHGTPR
ncbi:hypothetical protein EAG_04964 [Camponotus floridanus]|uniref:Uncharacterized protein n=1 Tax=Camponotus floridanus TaxID=104421 RepID=E2AMF8_CAMFO|nr:hypothetical protein EAG_04964 [Camponotus floridanus]